VLVLCCFYDTQSGTQVISVASRSATDVLIDVGEKLP
jgi:hypothetical protein